MTTYTVIGYLEVSQRKAVLVENVSKRQAWEVFKSHIGNLGWMYSICDDAGNGVYHWDRWAGEYGVK